MSIEYALKKFKDATGGYFGKEIEVSRIDGPDIYLKGKVVKVSFKTLLGASIFYNWRINNNVLSDAPITKEDVEFLESLLKTEVISILAVAFVLNISPSSMRITYKSTGSIWRSYRTVINNKGAKPTQFEWNGISGSADDWAQELEITKQSFRNRLAKHGMCYLVFLTKKQYQEISAQEKDKYINPNPKQTKRKYDIYSKNRSDGSNRSIAIDTESSILIIQRLIEDSKENLEKGPTKKNIYYENSYKFLLNSNGLLEYYLESVSVLQVSECLKRLKDFAEITDYKHKNKEKL